MTTLHKAAQQALEALQWHYRQGHSNTLGGFRLKIDEKALRELSAALAQQEEPAQKQVTYSTGGLHLEAGFYSEVDLREMLKALDSMNAAARSAMEETK